MQYLDAFQGGAGDCVAKESSSSFDFRKFGHGLFATRCR